MEGLYYLCSENKGADQLRGYENKGADQLRGYREADLRLCFRICKNPVFSRRGSNNFGSVNSKHILSPYLSCDMTKPVFGVSDQIKHKLDCAVTEDS